MKRIALLLLLLVGTAYSQEILRVLTRNPKAMFIVKGVNVDVDAAYELVAGNSFAQMNAADSIQVVASAADTVRVRIIGILASDSTRTAEYIRVPGTAAAVVSTKKYLFFEAAKIDSYRVEPTGTITFRTDDDSTTIAVIAAGKLVTEIAHRYFGRNAVGERPETGFLKSMSMSDQYNQVNGKMQAEVRFYPDWEQSRDDPGDGFVVLGEIGRDSTNGVSTPSLTYDRPVGYSNDWNGSKTLGWMAAFARSFTANDTVSVTFEGVIE